MSKNFELMQQIEIDRKLGSNQIVELAPHPNDGNNNNGNNKGRAHKQLAGDEALRLVQQVFLSTQEPPRVVVFAGIDHGNGCSRISASVAQALARNDGGSVCLVEANFRSPALPALFGTTNHYGLTDALLQEGPIHSFAKRIPGDNLWLLSGGSTTADSPSLLSLESLKRRIAELRTEFEFVIIDAPPLTKYADAISLGQLTDGLVLVLEANCTRRDTALAAVESLRSSGIKILGAVLNKRTFPIPEKISSRL